MNNLTNYRSVTLLEQQRVLDTSSWPSKAKKHPFHLVSVSPWPLMASLSVLTLLIGTVLYMHGDVTGGQTLFQGFLSLLLIMSLWWRDVIREGTFEGWHTLAVQRGIRYGMLLFIFSEIMFFFSFFWAFFHVSLVPSVELGGIWPPIGIAVFDPWGVPLVNTCYLLASGASVTWAHYALVIGNYKEGLTGLFYTIYLAIIFTLTQVYEYLEAPFSISDGVYGSTFFMTTGFHGFHVILGTIMLSVCALRLIKHHFMQDHHVGLEASIWYWHFVDVVWLFLFIVIYWWGGF